MLSQLLVSHQVSGRQTNFPDLCSQALAKNMLCSACMRSACLTPPSLLLAHSLAL